MEEKKFDRNSIIGFVLIFLILLGIMYVNKPAGEIQGKDKKEQSEKKVNQNEVAAKPAITDTIANDSLQNEKLKATLGSFAYAATLPSAKAATNTIENDLVKLTFSNKGGYIVDAEMKKMADEGK